MGLGFKNCSDTGRWCCIGDAVVEVSIWFLHPPYFGISSCTDCLAVLVMTFFCYTFLKFLKSWSECCSRRYCFNTVYIHFFSFLSGENMITVLLLAIFIILWSAMYLGWKVDAIWFLIKTSCSIFKSEALSNFLSSRGYFVSLESQSSSACNLHIHCIWVCRLLAALVLFLGTCSSSEDGSVYLWVDPCQKLRRMVTWGH